MRKYLTRIVVAVLAIMGALIPAQVAVYADDGCGDNGVQTSIIKNQGDCYVDTDGSGVFRILNIVVNVLTMGVGVLGTLGIIIAGIQYLTASGNEAQMAKAKQRIIEVVIGLVVFGVMWAVLQFVIPGGVFGNAS